LAAAACSGPSPARALVALPLLLRQGKGVNPTVLPRNYLRDWLLLEATIVLAGAVVLVVQSRRKLSA
jgi:hypothetical protein